MIEVEMLEQIHATGKILSLDEESAKLFMQKICELLAEQEANKHENHMETR